MLAHLYKQTACVVRPINYTETANKNVNRRIRNIQCEMVMFKLMNTQE